MSGFIDDDMPSGMEQPDTKMAVMGTPIAEGIDICSGLPLSALTGGKFPDPLGDTTPIPHPLVPTDIPGSKNDVG